MDLFQLPFQVGPHEGKAKASASSPIRRSASLKRKLTGSCRCCLLLCILLSMPLWPATAQVLRREAFALRNATQLIVVATPEWNAMFGVLQRYERSVPGGTWNVVGHPIAVVIGKNGLGWEAGNEAADPRGARSPNDPVKQEGDLRSPAGVFLLGTTFGYSSQRPVAWRMPYLALTPSTVCVDDPKSKFYNQVLDRTTVSPDWKSSQQMLRNDDEYHWGLVVEQNVDPAQPGDGSCIFLQIWPGPGQATDDSTATAQEQIENVLGWLDPAQNPLLVQLPVSKYDALQKDWGLPAIQ
jgi:L,D-peptidoglycan transpeptidase YkuD (ErfK/YbiS/YcfS/YnhG family)